MPASSVVIKDIEQYICDTVGINTAWDGSTGIGISINSNIIQSDDYQGRQSLTVDLDSVEIQLDFYPAITGTITQNFAKVALVYDTGFSTGGTSPAIGSIYQSATDTQPSPTSYYGSMFQNWPLKNQILILREWIIPAPEFVKTGPGRYTSVTRPDPISRPMILDTNVDLTSLGLVTKFLDATATPTTGHLILYIAPAHKLAANRNSYTGSIRLNYRSR